MKRLLLLAPLLLACLVPLSTACAPVMFQGERVAIASETALIVYDHKTKTEHFIRRGTFDTRVPYFGFLVPTPTKPELAEVPDDLFRTLGDWTKPKVITQTVTRPKQRFSLLPQAAMGDAKTEMTPGVAVLGEGNVAGLDYVILQGETAAELKKWLEQHNYATRPDLEEWLKPYVEKNWVLTAFQMKKPDQGKTSRDLQSKAVRMSFRTDEPFYPYLEPEGQRQEGAFRTDRLLRVFYASTDRADGSLKGQAWQGQPVWSQALEPQQQQTLSDKLKDKQGTAPVMPEKVWLTEFEDRSAPRPGGSDLFFASSPNQTTLERPPVINYVYVDEEDTGSLTRVAVVGVLGVLGLAALAFLLWRSLRNPV